MTHDQVEAMTLGTRVAVMRDGTVQQADKRPPASSSGTVIVGIRPRISPMLERPTTDEALPTIEVEASVVEDLGSATHVLFTIEAPPVDIESVRAASDDRERATLLATDRRALFTAELAEGTAVRPGHTIRLALDPGRLHFFDPETREPAMTAGRAPARLRAGGGLRGLCSRSGGSARARR